MTRKITTIISNPTTVSTRGDNTLSCTSRIELMTAPGMPTTIPANISSEIPFPIPRSLICSPTHIRKAVPAVNVITVNALKAHGLSVEITIGCPFGAAILSSPTAIAKPCIKLSAIVPYLV